MDWRSPSFLPLLSSLTTGNNRSSTIELSGVDAENTLSTMDKVLRDEKVPGEYRRDTICAMRKLAYNSGQIPPRYQVNRNSLSSEEGVFANGTFADIRRGSLNNKAVAIRTLRIDLKTDNNKSKKVFCKECIIWMNVSHPNLLRLISVDINPRTGQCSMVSEMMANGNIKEYIRKNSANRYRLLEGAAAGLSYLHEQDIVHGDLKGNNILITNETPPQACLADFGLSTLAPGQDGTITETTGGTPLYMAPELITPSKFNSPGVPTKPADIYAFGMVILEVLTGTQPFHEKKWRPNEVTYYVAQGARPNKPSNAEQIGFGDGTWKLVEECWMEDPMERPEIKRVLAHLTRVAESGMVVDPTPEIANEDPPLLDATDDIQLFRSRTTTARHERLPPVILPDPTAKIDISSPVSTISTASTASTEFTSTITPISSRDSEEPGLDVKPSTPLEPWATLSSTSSSEKLPHQHSVLGTELMVQQGKMLRSTIPMPMMLFAKPPKHSGWAEFIDRLGLDEFIDKLKSKREIRPTTPVHQILR